MRSLGMLTYMLALAGCGRAHGLAPERAPEPAEARCETSDAIEIGAHRMAAAAGAIVFRAGLMIDADGAPEAYHQGGLGLDHLANAGRPGSWWALVTDEHGEPVVQGEGDPAPGFYVSTTSLEDRSRSERDPRRYVDATRVPYVVLPGGSASREWLRARGARLGDLAIVHNTRTGRTVAAIWADVGPRDALGEGSIRLAQELGYEDASPRHGGTRADENLYVVLPGSGVGWPRDVAELSAEARRRFEAWGGEPRLRDCLR